MLDVELHIAKQGVSIEISPQKRTNNGGRTDGYTKKMAARYLLFRRRPSWTWMPPEEAKRVALAGLAPSELEWNAIVDGNEVVASNEAAAPPAMHRPPHLPPQRNALPPMRRAAIMPMTTSPPNQTHNRGLFGYAT